MGGGRKDPVLFAACLGLAVAIRGSLLRCAHNGALSKGGTFPYLLTDASRSLFRHVPRLAGSGLEQVAVAHVSGGQCAVLW